MFVEQMVAALDGARTLTRLDHLGRAIWQAHGGGAVGDQDAQALAERLEARRRAVRGELVPVGIPPGRPSLFPPRRSQRSPDRAASISRRRRLAVLSLPPHLAARFTVGQQAVLAVVGAEFARHGVCGLCVDQIAALAGVCRRMAQMAIREAGRAGLLVIEERRREGRKNDTNLIRVISREWLAWIRLHGCKMMRPTESRFQNPGFRPAQTAPGVAGKGRGDTRDRDFFRTGPSRSQRGAK